VKVLPENILTKLSAKDRKAIGQPTAAEAQGKYEAGQEDKLQKDMANLLTHRGVYWDRPPMNKRSRAKLGRADFICGYRKRFLALEAKAGTRKQTPEQVKDQASVERSGCQYYVIHNCDQVKAILDQIDAEIRIIQEALAATGWTRQL